MDRNTKKASVIVPSGSSLSARRAWIEIIAYCKDCTLSIVALRKESVDRNGLEINGVSYDVWSLSARRAWIEIKNCAFVPYSAYWSLSARRAWIEMFSVREVFANFEGRSPQGERG